MTQPTHALRRGAVSLLALILLALTVATPPAFAEDGDVVTRFDISYAIAPDGSIDVVEQIDYRFAEEDRHGIYRTLLTRARSGPGSDHDVLYRVEDVTVTSPDAPSAVSQSTERSGGNQYLELRVGEEDRTIAGRNASYEIRYTLRGALRTVEGTPEFYWNATGLDWDARIERTRITVTAPEGTTSLSCYAGEVDSTTACDSARQEGESAVFTQGPMDEGAGVTISAQLPVGSVANATPELLPHESAWSRAHMDLPRAAGAGAISLAALLALFLSVHLRRDRRYAGVAPGIVEPSAPSVPDDIDSERIPVRFSPPEIPLELAAALLRTTPRKRLVAASVVDLARRGAVEIHAGASGTQDGEATKKKGGAPKRTVVAADRSRAGSGDQANFLNDLLPPPKDRIHLDKPKKKEAERFVKASTRLEKAARRQVEDDGLLDRGLGMPLIILGAPLIFPIGLFGSIVLGQLFGPAALIYMVPVVIIGICLVIAGVVRRMGRRTAHGRALVDQIEGFTRYLSTAEAGQLRFEEGQDIFSAYLPWAIVFDLAERWQRVCAELAAAGRIPADPAWYHGPSFYVAYAGTSAGDFGGSLADSVTVSASSSSPSSGSSGGGFSGGGGGGGGGGSW